MAGNKENMRQAMKELLGLVGIGPEAEEDEERKKAADSAQEQWEEEPAVEKEELYDEEEEVQDDRHYGGFARRRDDGVGLSDTGEEPRQRESDFSDVRPFVTRATTTIISAGTSVFGDIRSEGEVEVQGKLKGNLEASGNIRITGKVLGDVKGDSIDLIGCAVQGNITAASTLKIDASTIVVGDIIAGSVVTDGKIKGNVQVEKSAAFQKNAVLAGNVIAGVVSMAEGAKIQGTVRISQDNDTNALFDGDLDI